MAKEFHADVDLKGLLLLAGSAGTSGQVLTSAGPGVAPTWETPSGGGGGGSYTISSTAPSSPASGDKWYDLDDGREYTYINDGDSSQWVDVSSGGGGGGGGNVDVDPVISGMIF